MVQHSGRIEGDDKFPCDSSIITKEEFWQKIYGILPDRDRRSVYRFMKRHFQPSAQKPHEWTEQQDKELIVLYAKHGAKWAYIARLLGRTDDDVVQRWKNRLEHRDKMRRGPWSSQEIKQLQGFIQEAYDAMAKDGTDVGKDIYEMDEIHVRWGIVSDKLENRRSRQQCADKWRKIRRYVLAQRVNGSPDAVYNPEVEWKPSKRRYDTPKAKPEHQYKSHEYVDSDADEDENEEGNKDANGPSKPQPASQRAKPQEPASGEKKPSTAISKGSKPAVSTKPVNTKPTSAADEPESGSNSSDAEPGLSDDNDGQSEEEQQYEKADVKQESHPNKKTDGKKPESANGTKGKANGENTQEKPKHMETSKEIPKPQVPSRSPEKGLKKQTEEGQSKDKTNLPSPSTVKTQERHTVPQQNRDRSPSAAESESEDDEESDENEESEDDEDDEGSESDSPAPEQSETKATKPGPMQKELPNPKLSEGKAADKEDKTLNNQESSDEEIEESQYESASSSEDEEQTERKTADKEGKTRNNEESASEEIEESQYESTSSSDDEKQAEPSTTSNKRKAEPEPAQSANPSSKRMKMDSTEGPKAEVQSSSEEESASDNESDDDESSESEPEAKPEPQSQPKPDSSFESKPQRLTLQALKAQRLSQQPIRPSIPNPPPQPSGSRSRSRSSSSSEAESSSSESD